jgi:glucose-6-phosphate isomerase
MHNNSASWQELTEYLKTNKLPDIRSTYSLRRVHAADITLDYSRHLVNDKIMASLFALAREHNVEALRDDMFSGKTINNTENRSVLHTALRRPAQDSLILNGEDIVPYVQGILSRIKIFVENVQSGNWLGYTGKPIKSIINIGIGGSDLGPRMVYNALRPYHNHIDMHFVSNVDGADMQRALEKCDPETSLFVIASKTFTTQETMMNANTAKQWLLAACSHNESAIAKHFVAVSTNEAAVQSFGIEINNMFPFRDWVGGRYSMWSSIGISIALGTSFDHYQAFLQGGHEMDQHFLKAPLTENMPIIMALLGIFYRNALNMQCQAIIPYANDMSYFPAWLQQTDMESNGKQVDREGHFVHYDTGPVIFGVVGTDCQHSFFQLIHQGTNVIPVDFIAPIAAPSSYQAHHRVLLANMVAQSQALAKGLSLDEAGQIAAKSFSGNRPSSVILMPAITPQYLGQLCALYEHKVFAQGIIWNINSFDQFGVELGKKLSHDILSHFENPLDALEIVP